MPAGLADITLGMMMAKGVMVMMVSMAGTGMMLGMIMMVVFMMDMVMLMIVGVRHSGAAATFSNKLGHARAEQLWNLAPEQ